MSETREALEMMKAVAKSRIEMLEKGITFHDKGRRNYYLHEYRDKLRKIEEIIRRMNIRLVVDKKNQGRGSASTHSRRTLLTPGIAAMFSSILCAVSLAPILISNPMNISRFRISFSMVGFKGCKR